MVTPVALHGSAQNGAAAPFQMEHWGHSEGQLATEDRLQIPQPLSLSTAAGAAIG